MHRLAREFAARRCDKDRSLMHWPWPSCSHLRRHRFFTGELFSFSSECNKLLTQIENACVNKIVPDPTALWSSLIWNYLIICSLQRIVVDWFKSSIRRISFTNSALKIKKKTQANGKSL